MVFAAVQIFCLDLCINAYYAPGHDVTLYASYCNESVVNSVKYTSNITVAVSDATVIVILPWFKLLPTMLVPQRLKYLIVNYQGSF